MVKLGRTKREDRSRAAKYQAVARALLRTARDLDAMGEPKYGNGLAVIAIHAAIAYTDAVARWAPERPRQQEVCVLTSLSAGAWGELLKLAEEREAQARSSSK